MIRLQLLTTLIAAMTIIADARADESPIAVSIAVPANSGGERRIEYGDNTKHFHVVVTNTSEKPVRLWREWCSWGYYGLSFEFTDAAGKKWVAKKMPRVWTRNFPDWWMLEAHESLVLDVHFSDADTWEGFPRPENGSQPVSMLAVFEFSPDVESLKHEVWTGRVTSKAVDVVFYHWK